MPMTPVDRAPAPLGGGANGAHGTDAALLRDRVSAAIGEQYLIHEEVGRGGMAVVYAAEDVRLQRPVALKVLPPDLAFRPDVRERFVREAQTAARLNHPHIVPIYAVHEAAGLVCFAMALVRGESLAARILRETRPDFAFVAKVMEQMADALAYAHAAGVVHRDIKPDNVLLDRESGRAMVTDFGIARAAESGSRLTQTGIAVGTPAFMSPEQAMGDKEVDGRSDLYSVGIVGYLMLAGRLPFEASSTPAMLMKHVSDTPPPLRSMRPDAPRALAEIVERCLAKRPQDRWENALQLRDALRRVQRDGSMHGATAATIPQPRPDRDLERFGHRAEDWAPRKVFEPAPAPRALPSPGALPPIPQLPPLPDGADRRTTREWRKANKEALKGWRAAVRDQRKHDTSVARVAQRDELRVAMQAAARAVTTPERIAARVMGFRRHLKWTAGASVGAAVSLFIGAGFNVDPMAVPFVAGIIGAVIGAQLSLVDFIKLRRMGISPSAALGEEWKRIAAVSDVRPHSAKVQELLDRVAGPAVMASRFAETVRNAADDRLVIADVTSKLSAADRDMIPDVAPTADALMERVGALASGLERLDRDLPGNLHGELSARLAATEAEPSTSPDRDRRLSLLSRQVSSLEELSARRDTMQRQLESASMALRTLRFDIVKLRTMGVGAAAEDITSATQEARALSRDLGYVIDAAEESRRL
ncbi:MAG TPA: serine/threonine protein kinase [Gemmatimonas aurantiaca]|uniref:non-specific serine/threonine protein kinase n=2 Tax=Gemmatimonas aurantiaca TaxID=173480 RepID=C1AAL9_GEMAT|nr:protein kinase [Gemmatimonas aurantiaca]BAH39817.1 putative serine/threonine protein kinase [Gemmatimonas aurantiaca T-27]HCT58172.1 serine/threonine protein kinase [Gemmatimonas aurantiaca]